MTRPAVFLDRDNTIIADPGYISDPDQVSLLPGAARSIRRLNAAGYAVVVVTNQSGVARGLVSEDVLEEIHDRLREVLAEQGARLDGVYYCPYLDGDEAVVGRYRQSSELRKPEPGMLRRAARELDLALDQSWMIGDSERDVTAGRRAGCRTILLGDGAAKTGATEILPDAGAESLEEAVTILLENPPRKKVAFPETANGVERVAASEAPRDADQRETLRVLEEIRDVLKRGERAGRFEDFSFVRLTGTLAQMLALVAGGWGIAALFAGSSAALARLALAGFFQLLALTAFVGGKRR